MLNFETIAEIAGKNGIGVVKAIDGTGGFIMDEAGKASKTFVNAAFGNFFRHKLALLQASHIIGVTKIRRRYY